MKICTHQTHCGGGAATTDLFGEALCEPCYQAFESWVSSRESDWLDNLSPAAPLQAAA